MYTFAIYHPKDGEMNYECSNTKFKYEHVADIVADRLEDVYEKAQNFNEVYALNDIRSTSVGDIIVQENGKGFMVSGMGFKQLSFKEQELMLLDLQLELVTI